MTTPHMPDTPDASPHVRTVNVGAVREVEWRGRLVTTGIWKSPIAGRVMLRGVNLDGDDQADRTVHGGPDKAVYAYALEDYAFWREEAALETPPGLFGENLTVEGIDLSASRVGDRWRVGSALLEVAQPRLPCFKLGIRVGDPRFPRRFLAAARPGAYLRIVHEGDVGAGDAIHVVSRASHDVTLRAMSLLALGRGDPAMLRGVEGLPAYWREVAAQR